MDKSEEKKDEKDPLVERLVAEGKLLRNSGTNSIKSVNKRLDKFSVVFDSIQKHIVDQTTVLTDIFKLQQDEFINQRNKDQIERVSPSYVNGPADGSGSSGNRTGMSLMDSADDVRAGTFGFVGGLFSNINWRTVFGIGSVAALFSAGAIGSFLLRGGVLLTLAPVIADFVGEFVEEGLKQINVDEAVAESAGGRANAAAFGAVIGRMFGARWAAVGAGIGFASTFSGQILDALGFTEEQMAETHNILGMELSKTDIASGVLSTMAFAAGHVLTSPSMWARVFEAAKNSPAWLARRGTVGTMIGTAVFSAYMMYGEDVKNWLEDQGAPADLANVTVDVAGLVATGASLGAMFGPTGMVVGAGIGLALGIGKSIYDWMERTKEAANREVMEALEAENPLQLGQNISAEMSRGEAPMIGNTRLSTQSLGAVASHIYEGTDADETLNLLEENPMSVVNRDMALRRAHDLVLRIENSSSDAERDRLTEELTAFSSRMSRIMSTPPDQQENLDMILDSFAREDLQSIMEMLEPYVDTRRPTLNTNERPVEPNISFDSNGLSLTPADPETPAIIRSDNPSISVDSNELSLTPDNPNISFDSNELSLTPVETNISFDSNGISLTPVEPELSSRTNERQLEPNISFDSNGISLTPPELPFRMTVTEPRGTPGYNEQLLEQLRRGLLENEHSSVMNRLQSRLDVLNDSAVATTQNFFVAPTINAPTTNVGGSRTVHQSNSTRVTSVSVGSGGMGSFAS